jgi:hypothetical protein
MTPLPFPALGLTLLKRYGRRDAFKALGVKYSQQNRNLNTGLSPRCPDGGYLIFITLDKKGFDPRHDYNDELNQNTLEWITRRGRGEDHPDYVNLRLKNTRVSLFVRHDAAEQFVYAGELEYKSHREFSDPPTGETQQAYTWKLKEPLPDGLYQQLHYGVKRKRPVPASGKSGAERARRPSSLDDYKRAFSYVLGSPDRTVIPAHYN